MVSDKNSDGKEYGENHLWRALCSGDRNALDQLFRLFYNPLLDYGLKIVRDEELIKDCVQELFIKVWQNRTSLSVPNSVKAYLLISIRRLILEQIKLKKNRYKREMSYINEVFTEEFSIEEIVYEDETDKERKKELIHALNQLNGKQKETIFLKYYHGLSNAEIAEVMGINHQSVKNNLFRAMQSLRVIIKSAPYSAFLLLLKSISKWF